MVNKPNIAWQMVLIVALVNVCVTGALAEPRIHQPMPIKCNCHIGRRYALDKRINYGVVDSFDRQL